MHHQEMVEYISERADNADFVLSTKYFVLIAPDSSIFIAPNLKMKKNKNIFLVPPNIIHAELGHVHTCL